MIASEAPPATKPAAPPQYDSVIIVGAGAFGLSTALHLSLAGYANITVLERGDTIPSRYSAANDITKIIRADYDDPFYRDLALVRGYFVAGALRSGLTGELGRKQSKTVGSNRSLRRTITKPATSWRHLRVRLARLSTM